MLALGAVAPVLMIELFGKVTLSVALAHPPVVKLKAKMSPLTSKLFVAQY